MRRLGMVVVVAAMLVISGCGRQVTGLNAPTANQLVPEGQTLIRFDTAGTLDFANVQYLIVINTTGNDQQPTAQGYNSDFKNWSYYFIVGGAAGVASNPPLYQIYQDPVNGGPLPYQLTYPSNSVNFQASIPSGNSSFGFQITFNRCLLDEPVPSASPPPINTTNRVCPAVHLQPIAVERQPVHAGPRLQPHRLAEHHEPELRRLQVRLRHVAAGEQELLQAREQHDAVEPRLADHRHRGVQPAAERSRLTPSPSPSSGATRSP